VGARTSAGDWVGTRTYTAACTVRGATSRHLARMVLPPPNLPALAPFLLAHACWCVAAHAGTGGDAAGAGATRTQLWRALVARRATQCLVRVTTQTRGGCVACYPTT
jgi:hypothetical protein